MTAVVQAEGLTKSYGNRRGPEDLTLEIQPGEIFGYLGPNGAGKTTTIRLLLDVIRPTRSSVRVLGADPREPAIRSRIGYLPGELALEGRERARHYLRFLGRVRGGVPETRIDALAERFEADLSVQMRKLSKGNRQKVGLIQAFMHEPEFLILDRNAIEDLVTSVLNPLLEARGGHEPLLETLEAVFASHGNQTAAARRLGLSPRAVTYRLERIRRLTGFSPDDPTQRFTLLTAVLGARLLGRPAGFAR
ncbi:ATP-binding cassette domain-containing protein [Nonomuraea sp. NPDC049709]|uniref:ATP-binding cassette domain-containing protein n=1 Tax=Nonomuraea sp. NPDC049709 TaxID=3154736 RepID=UPI0034183237